MITPDSSPDNNDYLYMRSPPWSPFNSSFSSTFSRSTSFSQLSTQQEVVEKAFSDYLSDKSCFFHDDDDGEEEKSWLERQRTQFHIDTRGFYRSVSSLPLLSDPPRLTPRQRSDSSISVASQLAIKSRKKKPSLGKQAKELFSFSLTTRKSSAKLSTAYCEQNGMDTPPLTPPFPAPPLLPVQNKKDNGDCKTCPNCGWGALQKHEGRNGDMLVTCLCHADLCFRCLKDWDYCGGSCASQWFVVCFSVHFHLFMIEMTEFCTPCFLFLCGTMTKILVSKSNSCSICVAMPRMSLTEIISFTILSLYFSFVLGAKKSVYAKRCTKVYDLMIWCINTLGWYPMKSLLFLERHDHSFCNILYFTAFHVN